MNLDSRQIDLIVREVLRHLETTGTHADHHSSSDDAPSVDETSTAALVVQDRVISAAIFDRDLSSIEQLVVPHNAVVTPLVVDMMRDFGISIQRQPPHGNRSGRPLEVGLYCDVDGAAEIRSRLETLPISWGHVPNIDQVLAQPVGSLTIAVTKRWAEWVSRVNQAGHVAVLATSVACLRDAWSQIRPTVLVMNPRSTTADGQVQLIEEFIRQVA